MNEFLKAIRMGGVNYPPTVRVAQTKSEQWAYPHYTKEIFKTEQIVYGKRESGLQTAYSDRLTQWDYDAHRRAHDISRDKFPVICADRVELYLSEYHKRPVELVYAMACFHQFSGHSVWFYAWRFVD